MLIEQILWIWIFWYANVSPSLRTVSRSSRYSQNDVDTIEGEMFKALVKAGAVSDANAVDHRKVDVQRAARTDAGVHAAGNVYVTLSEHLELN